MKKAISDLEGKNRSLAANLQQTDSAYRQKLAEVQSIAERASQTAAAERAAKEDATLAVSKLEGVIRSVQEDMAENQAAAEEARSALQLERAARLEAEQAALVLKRELTAIAAAEEKARSESTEQLALLQEEFEAVKLKLAELQAAKPKRAPRKTAAQKAAEAAGESNGASLVSDGEDGGEAAAPVKRRGRPKKTAAVGDDDGEISE